MQPNIALLFLICICMAHSEHDDKRRRVVPTLDYC